MNKPPGKMPFEIVESEVVVDLRPAHVMDEQQAQRPLVKLESDQAEREYIQHCGQIFTVSSDNLGRVITNGSDVASNTQVAITFQPLMSLQGSESPKISEKVMPPASLVISSDLPETSTTKDIETKKYIYAVGVPVSREPLSENESAVMTSFAKVNVEMAAATAEAAATAAFAAMSENLSQNYEDVQAVETLDGETEMTSEASICLVCGDKGSGFHYSAYSCEGCKGFFKRTVQKNMIYSCKDTGMCNVNKFTRNNCQYCRFQKCQDVGMKKEAVREDRTPGGKHRCKKSKLEDGESSSQVQPLLEDCIAQLIDAKSDFVPRIEDIFGNNKVYNTGRPTLLDIEDLMHFGYMELRFIIDWARQVPGFGDLLLDDQMALLKSSFMELNILRLAFRSLNCDGCVKFAEGIVMSADQCSNLGCGQDLIKCTMEFITRLRNVNIDNTEFCILNAIVLTYSDASGIVNKTSVTNLQNQMLDCLQQYSATRYPDEPRRYGRILLRLPALRTIGAKAAEMSFARGQHQNERSCAGNDELVENRSSNKMR